MQLKDLNPNDSFTYHDQNYTVCSNQTINEPSNNHIPCINHKTGIIDHLPEESQVESIHQNTKTLQYTKTGEEFILNNKKYKRVNVPSLLTLEIPALNPHNSTVELFDPNTIITKIFQPTPLNDLKPGQKFKNYNNDVLIKIDQQTQNHYQLSKTIAFNTKKFTIEQFEGTSKVTPITN